MKTTNILTSTLAVGLIAISGSLLTSCSDTTTAAETATAPSALEAIMTRTSIRQYQDLPVSEATVDTLLRAAMAAPSAGNKQPWRFIVIRDKATLASIAENFNTMKMAASAQLAIVVCGDLEATFPDDGTDYWIQDTSAATENLLLAAHSLGLGAVWCGIYPMKDRVQLLSQMLQLPDNIIPLNVVPIGYPAQSPTPKDKWDPEKIHQEKW